MKASEWEKMDEDAKLVSKVNEQGDKLNVIINMAQDLHARVTRLEAFQGLIELPEAWGITDERIIQIMENEGVPWDEAKEQLIQSYGQGESK